MNYRTVKLTVYSLAMWQAALVAKTLPWPNFLCSQRSGSSGHKARPATLLLTLSWLCRSKGSVTLSCISSSYFPIFRVHVRKKLCLKEILSFTLQVRSGALFFEGSFLDVYPTLAAQKSATGIDIEWYRQRCWSDLVSQKMGVNTLWIGLIPRGVGLKP